MTDARQLALDATRRLRDSDGFRRLAATERASFERDLGSLERALGLGDGWDLALETPLDLQRRLAGAPERDQSEPAPAPPRPRPASPVDLHGQRVGDALEAVDFPGFVAGLVTGTFQAIVDATAQQMREYADLVSSLTSDVDRFSRDNVSPGQVRQWLVEKHPTDLALRVPAPGSSEALAVQPAEGRQGSSPAWLTEFGLEGASLEPGLTDGALVQRATARLGEERMQTLATMVLMGLQRVVINEGHIRAKLQFHARSSDRRQAEIAQMSGAVAMGIAGRQVAGATSGVTQVSTMKGNTQADASMRTDLMGEVHVVFSTESFPLERFADTPAIQLIQRHARWKDEPVPTPATSEETS